MRKEYKTIKEFGQSEIIIEKSRFIGYAKPVESEEDAVKFINEIKEKHKDATHNVWAYTVGMNMEIQRYSDDGEPTGTAGIPSLEVIKKEDLRNVAVVVTRYFGGIKLGGGGLIRAYTKGAKIGLEAGKIINRILFKNIILKLEYTLLGKIQNEILNSHYIIKDTLYEDMVKMIVYSKVDDVEALKEKLIDITNGKIEIEEKEEFYLSEYQGKIILE
ncbi:YigZ family protein [Alkalithermobacter paradoxus]|uniref:IMPACT family member YigZ n=1 Tax=Alkalithermobacter paradoxus TaxID=29349 RepID=A0A1V4I9S5_9FIRM|nr:IMPACT family member YigZ [[Clostridium] thermoalcaliphilum]